MIAHYHHNTCTSSEQAYINMCTSSMNRPRKAFIAKMRIFPGLNLLTFDRWNKCRIPIFACVTPNGLFSHILCKTHPGSCMLALGSILLERTAVQSLLNMGGSDIALSWVLWRTLGMNGLFQYISQKDQSFKKKIIIRFYQSDKVSLIFLSCTMT